MLYLGDNPIAGLVKPLAGRNVGEIVASSLPLTDAGLHLLDGSLILGAGIYQGFVDYIAELYDNTSVSGYKLNVNVIGSVINNNCILSNFSGTNYTKMSSIFNPSSSSWEAIFKITTPSSFGTNGWIWGGGVTSGADYQGITLGIDTSGKTKFYLSSNGSSWDIASGIIGTTALTVNTQYYFKMEFTGTSYIISISTDGENWTIQNTITSSTSIYVSTQPTCVGGSFYSSANAEYWKGSIDLKESYININGQRWWTGTEEIKPIFCTEEQWQDSVQQYGVCGKFVYDSVNNTVRLPKYNSKIYSGGGTAPVKGNGMTLGFDNGTNTFGLSTYYDHFDDNAFPNLYGTNVGTAPTGSVISSVNKSLGITTDGTKSGIIADLANITTSLDGYYYIVVATTTKTDIQVDIDEIATDLNDKVDKSDLQEIQCVVETYINGNSWYRVYSDGWCEQGGYTSTNGTYAISLLKTMKDTNYSISLIETSNGTNNPAGSQNSIPIKGSCTINSIYVYINTSSGLGAYWEVKGYIEV